MIEVTTADAVGTLMITVGEVEAEVGVTMINASLWIRDGLALEVEVTGTGHRGAELEEVGLKIHFHDKLCLLYYHSNIITVRLVSFLASYDFSTFD